MKNNTRLHHNADISKHQQCYVISDVGFYQYTVSTYCTCVWYWDVTDTSIGTQVFLLWIVHIKALQNTCKLPMRMMDVYSYVLVFDAREDLQFRSEATCTGCLRVLTRRT